MHSPTSKMLPRTKSSKKLLLCHTHPTPHPNPDPHSSTATHTHIDTDTDTATPVSTLSLALNLPEALVAVFTLSSNTSRVSCKSAKCRLSLGRVVPAPHTQHLLGPFAAIAQNSLLRSLSIVDSLARKQHYCRGSEELAIRKSARFQATPSNFAGLRATPSGRRPRTPSYSELLRATPATGTQSSPSGSW